MFMKKKIVEHFQKTQSELIKPETNPLKRR